MKPFAGAVLVAVALAVAGSAQSQSQTSVDVSIDTNAPGAVISRNIYGQFAEHLGTGIYEGIWVGEDS